MGTTKFVSATGNDANPGTSQSAYLTIAKGCSVLGPGDTLRVLSGNYNGGNIMINARGNGQGTTCVDATSASRITVISDVKWGAKIIAISGVASPSGNQACWEVRANFWTIDGFEMFATGGYSASSTLWNLGISSNEWTNGFYISGNNCIVQNCYIHDIFRSTNNLANGGAAIATEYFYNSAGHKNSIYRNIISSIGPAAGSTTVHGIYLKGSSFEVAENLVFRSSGNNICCWHGADVGHIYNNTLFQAIGDSDILYGSGGGGAIAGAPHNYRIFNNIMYDGLYGLTQSETGSTGNIISNNLVFGHSTSEYRLLTDTVLNPVSASPQFVNYISTGGGNYHLAPTSPCWAGGLASLSGVTALATDLDAYPQPNNGAFDIGAYVSPFNAAPSAIFTNTPTFYVETVAFQVGALTAALFTNTQTFYVPTAAAGTANLIASLFINLAGLAYAHTLTGGAAPPISSTPSNSGRGGAHGKSGKSSARSNMDIAYSDVQAFAEIRQQHLERKQAEADMRKNSELESENKALSDHNAQLNAQLEQILKHPLVRAVLSGDATGVRKYMLDQASNASSAEQLKNSLRDIK